MGMVCCTAPPSPKKPTSTEQIYISFLADRSSSMDGRDTMTNAFMKEVLHWVEQTDMQSTIQFYNVAHTYPRPILCSYELQHNNDDKYSLEAKKRKSENATIRTTNQKATKQFLQGFHREYSNYNPKATKDGDYTYLDRHLSALSRNLMDTTFKHRVLLIYSDMIDHERGKKPHLLSKTTIEQLNRAIQTGAAIYVVTYVNTQHKDLRQLNATFLTHYSDFLRHLTTIQSSLNI